MAASKYSEIVRCGRLARRLHEEEFPGKDLDHNWLVCAYGIDSTNRGWPDGGFDHYEKAATGKINEE